MSKAHSECRNKYSQGCQPNFSLAIVAKERLMGGGGGGVPLQKFNFLSSASCRRKILPMTDQNKRILALKIALNIFA